MQFRIILFFAIVGPIFPLLVFPSLRELISPQAFFLFYLFGGVQAIMAGTLFSIVLTIIFHFSSYLYPFYDKWRCILVGSVLGSICGYMAVRIPFHLLPGPFQLLGLFIEKNGPEYSLWGVISGGVCGAIAAPWGVKHKTKII